MSKSVYHTGVSIYASQTPRTHMKSQICSSSSAIQVVLGGRYEVETGEASGPIACHMQW